MIWIYESHMGGIYTSDEPLEWEDLYCETCNDSDTLIGTAETEAECERLVKDYFERRGSA